jgi:hypothetical protein
MITLTELLQRRLREENIQKLRLKSRVLLREYDDASGMWGDFVERLSDMCWEYEYPNDVSRSRFSPEDTLNSAELRFDHGPEFLKRDLKTIIAQQLTHDPTVLVGQFIHAASAIHELSKYGRDLFIAPFLDSGESDDLVVSFDGLSEIDPYVALFLKPHYIPELD